MKFVLLVAGLFCSSVSFAGTMTCLTKEEPAGAKMVNQTSQSDYTDQQAYLNLPGKADPQIHFEALGDDRGIWVFVQDLRTGIAAENQGAPAGTSVNLNMGKAGEFSLYCHTK